tara:strand:+ start:713 stop:1006 length:294 start_codon:yes stop_codon:yes gene_type:complete
MKNQITILLSQFLDATTGLGRQSQEMQGVLDIHAGRISAVVGRDNNELKEKNIALITENKRLKSKLEDLESYRLGDRAEIQYLRNKLESSSTVEVTT